MMGNKPDLKRDYYGDLEIQPGADSQEITTAYRRLAKLYHPDRNPGKTDEFVPKFQAIQSAYEVLNDSSARAEYDQKRRKFGITSAFARPNRATTNPYAQGFAQPPRPPRPPPTRRNNPPPPPPPNTRPPPEPAYSTRPTQGSRPPPEHSPAPPPRPSPKPAHSYYGAPPPSAGAQRFSNFNRPPPPQSPTGSDQEFASRQQAWTAWQRMKEAEKMNSRPRAKAQETRDAPDVPSNKPGLSRSHTTTTPRKAGFDPNDPAASWEPQASGTNAYSRSFRTRLPVDADSESDLPPPPPGPPPNDGHQFAPNDARKRHSVHHEHLRPFSDTEQPFAEGRERVPTPYSAQGGEKTYFSNDFIRRSASVRDNARLNTPGRHVPSADAHRPRSSSPMTRMGRSDAAPRPSSMHNQQTPPNVSKARSKHTPTSARPSYEMYSSSTEDESPIGARSSGSSGPPRGDGEAGPFGKNGRTKAQPGKAWRNRSERADSSFPSPSPAGTTSQSETEPLRFRDDTNTPFFDPTTAPGYKPQSTENINTQFSASDWQGKFEGTQFAPPSNNTAKPHARSSGRRATSPTKRQQSATRYWFDGSEDKSAPRGPAQETPFDESEEPEQRPQAPKFSSEEWRKTFKESSWAHPGPSISPSKTTPVPSRKTSQTPLVRKGSRSTNNLESFDGSTVGRTQSAPAAEASSAAVNGESDAMDVDTPPADETSVRGPRLVPVQPIRPEWREPTVTSPNSIPSAVPNAQVPPPPPPPPPVGAALKAKVDAANAALKDGITLAGFQSVFPLAPQGDGIGGITDLSSSLPFESKPATQPLAPVKLDLPPCPRGPDPPVGRITQAMWKMYLARMSAYMGQWYLFEDAILAHFSARHLQSARFGKGIPSLEATRLLEMAGEPSQSSEWNRMGLLAYKKGLEEDERVRKGWNLACERHSAVVEAFIGVKERILKEGLFEADRPAGGV